jgi:nitric oxide dioxygenase
LHDSVFEGDTLDVASPYGDFAFEDSSTSQTAPVILLSAGVGQTALLSILNSLLPLETTSTMDSPSRAIAYIHVARNERVHAFAAHLRELAHRHRNLRYHVFYTAPSDAILGQDYDFDGRMDLAKVKDDLHISDPTAEY